MIADFIALEFRAEAQSIYSWLICVAALIWGGSPERAIALVWLVLFKVIDGAYHWAFDAQYQLVTVDAFHASIDGMAAIAWGFIAVNANRNYPMWIAAMQLLAATAHLARGLAEPISPVAYATMAFAPAYFQLLFLTVGLIRHIRRKKRYGEYRDWRVPMPFPFGPKAPPDVLKGQS